MTPMHPHAHAVARLRAERLARSTKPFLARGGMKSERCPVCRVAPTHCLCTLRPALHTQVGVCLLMADIEPIKPTNTGWLIADVVTDTFAFGWSRTAVDPDLLALLADPQWLPLVVFPGEFVAPERVVHHVPPHPPHQRPLFVMLDATWPEARKMFRKSPYLAHLPVLSLQPDQVSRYQLRRSRRNDHFCTSEVAAMCLELAGDAQAGEVLSTYLDVFSHHYLQAKQQRPADWASPDHQRLQALCQRSGTGPKPTSWPHESG